MPNNRNPVVIVLDGKVSVQPDPLLFRGDRIPVFITWEIASSEAYRFAENGVTIESKSPTEEFTEPGRIADGRKFKLLNKNSKPGTYKYTIRLIDPAGRPVEPLDPSIINME